MWSCQSRGLSFKSNKQFKYGNNLKASQNKIYLEKIVQVVAKFLYEVHVGQFG